MRIHFEEITHIYGENTPFERMAIERVDAIIEYGSYVSIIGHTGSGKSTLIQHVNGLLKPTIGKVMIDKNEISNKTKEKELYHIRKNIGFLFQQPEHQLFEETVEKELLFAVNNYGLSVEEAKKQIPEILKMLMLPIDILEKSPYELSGGQKKRIALACLLLLQPSVFVLDEPLAGLDPDGQALFLKIFDKLNNEGKTLIMITHNIDLALESTKQVLVMNKGKVLFYGTKEELIENESILLEAQLELPYFIDLRNKLSEKLHQEIPYFYSLNDAIKWFISNYKLTKEKEKSNA